MAAKVNPGSNTKSLTIWCNREGRWIETTHLGPARLASLLPNNLNKDNLMDVLPDVLC